MIRIVKVKEVMKKKVITINPTNTFLDAARIMTNNKVGSLVIVGNGGKVEGIVTESDVTTVVSKDIDPKKIKISERKKRGIKKEKLVSVKPNDNILDVAKVMVKHNYKRVPVMDKGKLLGIIADKEILIISPELIEIMSEKLKARVDLVHNRANKEIEGMCEDCGGYSDELKQNGGRWICQECRADE